MMATLFRNTDSEEHGQFGCMRTLANLQEYIDGELDELSEARLREHLEACERCGLRAEAYQTVKDALSRRRQNDPDMVERLRGFASGLMGHDVGQTAGARRLEA